MLATPFFLYLILLCCLLLCFSNVCFSFINISNEGNIFCDSYDCSIDKNIKNKSILKDIKHVVDNKYPLYEMFDPENLNDSIFFFITSYLIEPMSYSGKPLELLIGIDRNCYIKDIRLLKHSEPIILVGIPLIDLLTAVSSYKNKCIKNTLLLGSKNLDTQPTENIKPITSATVTSIALHDTIIKSSRLVACDLGFIQKESNLVNLTNTYVKYNWESLLKIGAIKHFIYKKNNTNSNIIDVFFADITHPSIGINLFGEEEYYYLQSLLGEHESILFIINSGTWSFKGSGFVRGGLFERFHIKQNNNTFFFHDYNFRKMSNIILNDCPEYLESGLFILKNKEYTPAIKWDLIFVYSESGTSLEKKDFETFSVKYSIPSTFVKKNLTILETVWLDNFYFIFLYIFLWFLIILIFFYRKPIIKFSSTFFDFFYIFTLCSFIIFLGCFCGGQPSIVNVFAIASFFVKENYILSSFLVDPFFVISWFFVSITTILWGRSFFCGWICPFGSLQELIFRLREFFTPFVFSFEFNIKIRYLLNFVRFFIFIFLFCLAFYSLEKAEIFSEIEPFKTTWNISILSRGFLGFYAIFILISSLVMYRWFCRFICPLGAFLSLISLYLSVFKIPRRNACLKCNICRKRCKSKAIDTYGKIDVTKCLGCFDCINAMYNKTICPPLLNKKIWIAFNEKD